MDVVLLVVVYPIAGFVVIAAASFVLRGVFRGVFGQPGERAARQRALLAQRLKSREQPLRR